MSKNSWPPKKVQVWWKDSMSTYGWSCGEDKVKYNEETGKLDHISVGFLINETDEYISLTHSVGLGVHNYCDSIIIPKAAVSKIIRMK